MNTLNKTMYAVAYLRYTLLKDDISGILIKEHLEEGKKIAEYINSKNNGMFSANVLTRDYYFKYQMKKYLDNFDQLLILGVGLDTKINQELLTNKIIFGIDICGEAIINIYKNANIPLTANIISADLNSLNKNILNKLESKGFSKNKKTFLLWEGGTFYFKSKKVFSILNFFIDTMAISGISLDYLNKNVCFDEKHSYRNIIEKILSFLEQNNEPWLGFFTPNEIELYFRSKNFSFIENRSHHEIEKEITNNSIMLENLNYFITAIK